MFQQIAGVFALTRRRLVTWALSASTQVKSNYTSEHLVLPASITKSRVCVRVLHVAEHEREGESECAAQNALYKIKQNKVHMSQQM